MTKQTLRAEVSARVKNLSPTYCREADAAICRWVIQSAQYQEAGTIFCYVGTEREIDTMALLRDALRDGKTLAVPLCLPEKGLMEARRIEGLGDLVSGRYGILAPKLDCPVVAPESFDLAIVPCCTGNAKGQRLGYGGGRISPPRSMISLWTILLPSGALLSAPAAQGNFKQALNGLGRGT